MVIVASGKLVIGLDVYSTGDAIDGLPAADERKIVATGLAVYPEDGAEAGEDAAVQIVPTAKEPTKAELQAMCRELGLSDKGNKAELQARIDAAEAECADEADEADDEPPALTAEVPR
jgi:hypothetical protein